MDMILVYFRFQKKVSIISETYVVGIHWNCLREAIRMCIYNICPFNK